MTVHPLAGTPAPAELLIDTGQLRHEYYARRLEAADGVQRVSFGTSGHRGSSLDGGFNEAHVLAITQAICNYRHEQRITGPIYVGRDTHALSEPALMTALEVLAANGVETMIDADDRAVPTPLISHAIGRHNCSRPRHLADGIVITPSHNPPGDGGFKYNPPHGGPAAAEVTRWIEDEANCLLTSDRSRVARIPYERARRADTTHRYDYVWTYVSELRSVVDMEAIRHSGLKVGIDPLGGASVAVWRAVNEQHGAGLEVVNESEDPTFRFVPLDWDGRIRMDCSSAHAMATLVRLKDRFDIAVGNDPDADRHGIVTRSAGLMNPNHYLAAAIAYLFTHRPLWPRTAAVGKTVVSSSVIDRVAKRLGRTLVEVPVGFKWFVPGLLDGSLGFGGEESAGASFLRRDGVAWTTDKDGILMGLLAIEIMARTGRAPSEVYADVTRQVGSSVYERVDAPATDEERALLLNLSPSDVLASQLAGDPIEMRLTTAPGNGAPVGGLKIATANGWFAARPSGTEAIYKLYAESFRGLDHLRRIQQEAQALISTTLSGVSQ